MKTKFFLLAISLLIAIGAQAQKGIDTGTPYGSGQDSINCITNTSLYIPYFQSKNYKDAYPFWKKVYDECPASNKNIYIAGVSIINWQMSEATDPAQRAELLNALLKLYDDRAKYFGDDPQYRKDWVIATKAEMYDQLTGNNTDYQLVYKWTGEAIEEFKDKTHPKAIGLYMFASFKLMQGDMDKFKTQYINDFLKCTDYLENQLTAAEAANNEKAAEDIKIRKADMEQNFALSGAADCAILNDLYMPRIQESKADLEALREIMTMLRRVRCNESDAFITASEYAYQIAPTADAAQGLGNKALKNKDYNTAEKFLLEAIGMSDNSSIRGDLYFVLQNITHQQGQYQKSKQYFQKCIAETPDYGKAYVLIANTYALAGRNLFPDDPVLNKLIFYAVVDKLEKARQIDKSVADEANKGINTYSKYFPTKEEVFMHPSLNKVDTYTLPGWIGETVKIRK